MASNIRRILIAAGAAAMAISVFVLGRQNRSLKEANRDLVTRFTQPHRGLIVPSFRAASLSGDSVTIGQMKADGRQVLFFFTTTCQYCRNSFAALAGINSALARDTLLNARLFAIGLDSTSAIQRFADSARLSYPVLLFPERRLSILYRLRGVPQLIVLDSSGRVPYARSGELREQPTLDSVMRGIAWRPTLTLASRALATPSP